MKYRKVIRLKNYDYKTDGYYFVTICTAMRRPLLEKYKIEVETLLKDVISRFPGVSIDFYSITPNHIHVIFILNKTNVALGNVVRTFKALVTKSIGCKPFWEWNYYEHIIRNEKALYHIRKYIQENPLKETIDWKTIYSGINAAATTPCSGAIYRTDEGGAIYRTDEGGAIYRTDEGGAIYRTNKDANASGVALIIVIFAMLLFAVLGWTLANLQTSDFEANLRNLDSEQALNLAEAASHWALNQLSQDSCGRTRSGVWGPYCGNVDADCNDNGDWLSAAHNLGSGQYNICCREPTASESALGYNTVVESRGYIPSQTNYRARREIKLLLTLGSFNKVLQAKNLFDWSAMHSGSRINGDAQALYYNGDADNNYNEPNIDYREGASPLPPDGRGDERTIASEPYPTIDMAYYESEAKNASYPPAGDNIWAAPRTAKIVSITEVVPGKSRVVVDASIFSLPSGQWDGQALRNISRGAWGAGSWQTIQDTLGNDSVDLTGTVNWAAGDRVMVVPKVSSLNIDIPTRTYTITFDCSLSWSINEAVRNFTRGSWSYADWGVLRSISIVGTTTTITVRVDDSVDLSNPANQWLIGDWIGEVKRYRDDVTNQYLWYIMADALFDLRDRQSWEPGSIDGNILFRQTGLVAEGDIAIKGGNRIRFTERPFAYPNIATKNGNIISPDTPNGGSDSARRGQRDFNDILYTENGGLYFNYLDAKAAYANNITFDGQVRLNYDSDLTQLTGFAWGISSIKWSEQ